ncbi:ATP-grasp domain-containing protein [Streptomyces sp. YGL11-2]|uniref:preATP grasp domain-containing protein n=1 Tax=Streptomyces sp. YGL11-2 TaxID=3414028 RepID=UPI003CECA844
MDDFSSRLKTAVAGTPDASLVFLGNFEVEEQWARDECTLPRVSAAGHNAVVNHMDSFALLMAGERDHVVLKAAPDAEYLDHLTGLGVALPTVHVVAKQDPRRTVTEDALEDPALLERLAGRDRHLVAHGVSAHEELLAHRSGVPLAAPDAAVCKAVNNKVYSRRVAGELDLRQPPGWACASLTELEQAFAAAGTLLDQGRKVVVKEGFGVSGKGIAALDSARRMDRVLRMIAKQVKRSGRERIAFCVEEWVASSGDLNYQFTLGRDGSVHFDFVKEQLTDGGVHKGHRMPARLCAAQVAELREAARAVGARLAADGYFGVVGVDAMIDPDGGLYPVIEINARNNMSTYQVPLQEHFVGPSQVALARHYPVRLTERLGFGVIRDLLDGLLLDRAHGTGLLVNNFGTVNAGARADASFDGRLYGVLIGGSDDEVLAIDAEITTRLAERGIGDGR